MALTTAIFMLILASYPQEVIAQLPNSIVFYIIIAAIAKLKDFDDPIEEISMSAERPTFKYPKRISFQKQLITIKRSSIYKSFTPPINNENND